MRLSKKSLLLMGALVLAFAARAQDDPANGHNTKDHLSSQKGEGTLGLGIGLPYGALGLRIGVNVIHGLNLFGGIGYQLSGVGYNVGLLKDFPSSGMTQFYLTAMYGTNAAIKVSGLSGYDKLYKGPTFGPGIKINSRKTEGNYWDVGLLFPARSSDYRHDEAVVRNDPRITSFQSPLPVLIVVGYNFNL
jgi:hypothetical protein